MTRLTGSSRRLPSTGTSSAKRIPRACDVRWYYMPMALPFPRAALSGPQMTQPMCIERSRTYAEQDPISWQCQGR